MMRKSESVLPGRILASGLPIGINNDKLHDNRSNKDVVYFLFVMFSA